jgi:hypothetical protein
VREGHGSAETKDERGRSLNFKTLSQRLAIGQKRNTNIHEKLMVADIVQHTTYYTSERLERPCTWGKEELRLDAE